MKSLSFLAAFFGLAALAAAIYLMAVVAPRAEIAESVMFSSQPDSFYGSSEHEAMLSMMDLKTNLGVAVLFAGLLAFLLGIYPAIKKMKPGVIGVVAGLAAAVIGAVYGTHMFS